MSNEKKEEKTYTVQLTETEVERTYEALLLRARGLGSMIEEHLPAVSVTPLRSTALNEQHAVIELSGKVLGALDAEPTGELSRGVCGSDTKAKEALGRLLAAEAEFLNDLGWNPVVVASGEVHWRLPNAKSAAPQDVAVKIARERLERES